jgi:hypothetical protein
MRYLILLLLLPYIVGFKFSDSSYTEVSAGAGGGRYEYADCNGEHHRNYFDGGVMVKHKFEAPIRVGVAMGSYPEQDKNTVFVYPELAFDNNNFALGTTGIRVGKLRSTFFEIKGLDEVPFASGRGIFRVGIGMPIESNNSHLWLGTNAGPYMNWGPAAGYEFPLDAQKMMFINGRIGWHNEQPEYGLSVGFRLRN